MAINKNHEFEELNEVKCAIVEKNIPQERVDFLKPLLEFNKYTVVVAASAPPKPAPPPKPVVPAAPVATTDAAGETIGAAQVPVTLIATPDVAAPPPLPPAPTTFTVGVTDVRFNAINAIFGRLLKSPDGYIVTLAYWQQKEAVSNDAVPYFEK